MESAVGEFALSPAVLQLQEAHHQVDRLRVIDQELRRDAVVFAQAGCGCTRRTQNAELPTGLILARRTPVGVKQVAFVQYRVRDGAGPLPAGCHRTASWLTANNEVTA